ncbi:MAG: hypothetical protein EHM91_02035 [Planctomycetota bacterium]|nr:MAG: hypothetical protein EHM91_02035 [Planctomycetota bacterium]
MKTTIPLWSCLLLLAVVHTAVADEVVLKNGSKLEGTVTETGNKVIIDVGSGTITVDRSEVASINRPDELNREFDHRMQSVRSDDAESYYQVYLWAKKQDGLKSRTDRLLRKIVEIDPNHEQSRRALGYVNHKGAWLTQDELKGALGLVRYNGGWVTAETAERLKRLDHELSLAQMKETAEAERAKAQLEIERDQIMMRQQIIDLIEQGELPNVQFGPGAPWGLRYWGPAVGARQLPAE